jgi:hypothetical protein
VSEATEKLGPEITARVDRVYNRFLELVPVTMRPAVEASILACMVPALIGALLEAMPRHSDA